MAIQVIQQPGSISFAGDPIIAKALTTLIGKTFLKITLECKVELVNGDTVLPYSEKYTYTIGEDRTATFNVGKTVQTAFDKYTEQDVDKLAINQQLYAARFQLTYKEIYLNGVSEEEGSAVVSEWYHSVMGRLTAYERMTMPNADTTAVIGEGRMLTRKPDGEIIPQGIDLYVPALSTQSGVIDYYTIQDSVKKSNSHSTGGANVPASLKVNTSGLLLGALNITTAIETGKSKHVVVPSPFMRHFLFLNGFGLIESITATMREKMKYTIDSEKFIIPGDVNFKGYTRVVSYTKSPQVELEMSSGYVNREWADWWMNEFLPSGRGWMLQDGRYIPIAIIPEDNYKLFDKSKPGMIAIQFKVQYSFTGGTSNSFLR